MAVKQKKLPKSPSRKASNATLDRWIKRAEALKKSNRDVIAEQRKNENLWKRIERIKAEFKKY